MGKKKKKPSSTPKKDKPIIIGDKSLVRCPWCDIDTEAKKWNDLTFSYCTSREMKREFRDIYDKQVWGKGSDHFYICPACKNWSRGNQLRLVNKLGDIIEGLGGNPVIS